MTPEQERIYDELLSKNARYATVTFADGSLRTIAISHDKESVKAAMAYYQSIQK